MRRAWRIYWHGKATRLRQEWNAYVMDWEDMTEPGYPLSPFDRDRHDFALADVYDTIGGRA